MSSVSTPLLELQTYSATKRRAMSAAFARPLLPEPAQSSGAWPERPVKVVEAVDGFRGRGVVSHTSGDFR